MIQKIVLLAGLALSFVHAAPNLAPLTHDNVDQITTDQTHTGSVSDNACWVKELPNRAPTFRHPEPDVCVPIEAFRQLKIYHTATCSNGTEARLARYDSPRCIGEPVSIDDVDDDMLKKCLQMPSKEAGSYAFWCEGDIEPLPEKKPAPGPNQPSSGGSIWGFLGIMLIIFGFMLLIAILKLLSLVQRATNTGNKFLGLFGRKDGAIALN